MINNSLYARLGEEKISQIVSDFYKQAFVDPIIGHFFHGRDQNRLISQQTDFAIGLLGGPRRYRGSALDAAHSQLNIRPAHFDRRQRLLKEIMQSHEILEHEINEWLVLEENLRRLIVTVTEACAPKQPDRL